MSERNYCPRDGTALEVRVGGSARIRLCPRCNGLWVAGGDLAEHLSASVDHRRPRSKPDAVGSVAEDHAPLRCTCALRPLMDTRNRAGVLVDVCHDCGSVWLDGGEFTELLERFPPESRRGNGSGPSGPPYPPTEAVAEAGLIGLLGLLDLVP